MGRMDIMGWRRERRREQESERARERESERARERESERARERERNILVYKFLVMLHLLFADLWVRYDLTAASGGCVRITHHCLSNTLSLSHGSQNGCDLKLQAHVIKYLLPLAPTYQTSYYCRRVKLHWGSICS